MWQLRLAQAFSIPAVSLLHHLLCITFSYTSHSHYCISSLHCLLLHKHSSLVSSSSLYIPYPTLLQLSFLIDQYLTFFWLSLTQSCPVLGRVSLTLHDSSFPVHEQEGISIQALHLCSFSSTHAYLVHSGPWSVSSTSMQAFLNLSLALSTSQFLIRTLGTLITWGRAAEMTFSPGTGDTAISVGTSRPSAQWRRFPSATEAGQLWALSSLPGLTSKGCLLYPVKFMLRDKWVTWRHTFNLHLALMYFPCNTSGYPPESLSTCIFPVPFHSVSGTILEGIYYRICS